MATGGWAEEEHHTRTFISQALLFSYLFFLVVLLSFTINNVETAGCLTGPLTCSPKVLQSTVAFCRILLFFFLINAGWRCSEKRVRGFVFVMVHRDCSVWNLQIKIITLFLQIGKGRLSERKPYVQMYATGTCPQGHFWR